MVENYVIGWDGIHLIQAFQQYQLFKNQSKVINYGTAKCSKKIVLFLKYNQYGNKTKDFKCVNLGYIPCTYFSLSISLTHTLTYTRTQT